MGGRRQGPGRCGQDGQERESGHSSLTKVSSGSPGRVLRCGVYGNFWGRRDKSGGSCFGEGIDRSHRVGRCVLMRCWREWGRELDRRWWAQAIWGPRRQAAPAHPVRCLPLEQGWGSSPHSSLGSSEPSPQSSSPSHFQRAGIQRPESLQRNSSTPQVIWAARGWPSDEGEAPFRNAL